MNYSSFITELQSIRQQKNQLAEEESRLLTPLLTDLSDVEVVYNIFKSLVEDPEPRCITDLIVQRKKFLFIVLCFFSPGAMAGDRLPHGLRGALAKVINSHPTFISDNTKTVGYLYQKIKAYREELQYLYSAIEKELKALGKIGDQPYEAI